MHILMLNGSPRLHGNTKTALTAIQGGINANMPEAKVELLDLIACKLMGCVHCDACQHNGGNCVLPSDNAAIIRKIAAADCVVFGSPVYWWGVSAHLKMAMDSMYSQDGPLKTRPKALGLVLAGHHTTNDPQYRIIREQFSCICNYLGWTLAFAASVSTPDIDTLAKDRAQCAELSRLWATLR